MRRGIFGGLILAALLISGFLWAGNAERQLLPLESVLEEASGSALEEDWEKTTALTEKARAAWENLQGPLGCLGNQESVREISSLFDEAQVYLQSREAPHCSAACMEIRNRLRFLREDQMLHLPDLL